jgi:putative glutamine amidotransferase
MTAKPLIGIPCYQEHTQRGQRPRWAQVQTYSSAVQAAGGLPILLPLVTGHALREMCQRMDALLLPGGDDLNPSRYGEAHHPATQAPDDLHDEVHLYVASYLLENNTPFFAICRGLQVLNVAAGGTLVQDIPSQLPHALRHEFDYEDFAARHAVTHEVDIAAGSRLASIMGLHAGVNSYHHQAIKQLGAGLTAVAHAPDGLIEAVEVPGERFAVAVQWHPEDMFHANDAMLALFSAFVKAV